MKKLMILLIILGAAKVFFERYQHYSDEAQNPSVIANPVYAEVHVSLGIQGRSFDQVILVKTVDNADCNKTKVKLETVYGPEAAKAGQEWEVRSSDCKSELSPRYARLFENEPTHVTYLSMSRGAPRERETRMITWGISVEESNKLCEGLSQTQRSRQKGEVTCIRAFQS